MTDPTVTIRLVDLDTLINLAAVVGDQSDGERDAVARANAALLAAIGPES